MITGGKLAETESQLSLKSVVVIALLVVIALWVYVTMFCVWIHVFV